MSGTLRIALLGGSGFVGGAVLRQLEGMGDVEVRALAHSAPLGRGFRGLEVVRGGLPAPPPDLFFDGAPHVVVHLGTKQIDHDGGGFEQVNVEGTTRLLEALPAAARGVIYGSSLSVLGQGAQEGVTEAAPVRPGTALARSRARAERAITTFTRTTGRSAALLRPRFILGRGDRFTLPGLLRMARRRLMVGSGEQVHSVIDVDDYARIIVALARKMMLDAPPRQRALHVGYTRPVSLNQLVAALRRRYDLPPARLRLPVSPALFDLVRRLAPALATQLELVGLPHHADVSALAAEVGAEIVGRDPLVAVEEAVELCTAR